MKQKVAKLQKIEKKAKELQSKMDSLEKEWIALNDETQFTEAYAQAFGVARFRRWDNVLA